MERRRKLHKGISIGAAIGAVLGAVFFDYLAAFTRWGFSVGFHTAVGAMVIGATLGVVVGWGFSRPRPSVEEVMGVPTSRRIRIVMWIAGAMAICLAVVAVTGGELVAALGWLGLAGGWILQASGAAERARTFLHLSGVVFLLGILLVGTGFILGEL